MILIVTFTVFNGSESVDKAQVTEIYLEMTNMMKAVDGVILQMQFESGDESWLSKFYDEDMGNGWYLIKGMNTEGYESSNVRNNLNMDTIKRDYLVNYDNGEVMLSKPVNVVGGTARSYKAIRALVESDKL